MKKCSTLLIIQFSSVQSFSHVWLFATLPTVACPAPLPFLQLLAGYSLGKNIGMGCHNWINNYHKCSVWSLSHVQLFATPLTAAHQASLSITNSQSLPKLMFIESVMPSNYLIHCRPLLLSSIFPNIRVFSNESALRIRRPKYWSFRLNTPTKRHRLAGQMKIYAHVCFHLTHHST